DAELHARAARAHERHNVARRRLRGIPGYPQTMVDRRPGARCQEDLYSSRTIRYISAAVSSCAGQHGGPPGALMPISRWGELEIPTSPQPTSAMSCPADTCAPTDTSAGRACP